MEVDSVAQAMKTVCAVCGYAKEYTCVSMDDNMCMCVQSPEIDVLSFLGWFCMLFIEAY